MKLLPVGRMQISRSLQLVFILADFGHGIALGERDSFLSLWRKGRPKPCWLRPSRSLLQTRLT